MGTLSKRASRELSEVNRRLGEEWAGALLQQAERSPDAEAGIAAFARLAEGLRGCPPSFAEPLYKLLEAAPFFVPILSARPSLLRWLRGSRSLLAPRPSEAFDSAVRGRVERVAPGDEGRLLSVLRRYKYRELLRIAYRDAALGAPAAEIGREMTSLAQALTQAACAFIERMLKQKYGEPETPGFCVLGMGKFGGGDLNFSSDIDLIYLYRAEGDTSGGAQGSLSSAQFYAKLAEGLTRALSSKTQDGFCFRVDLNLRPHGRSGAIALPLNAALTYYETFGRAWERSALLKARCIAGDESLAHEFFEGVAPFVWRRHVDMSAVDALREMKAQIDLRAKASLDDVKLGPGGIREIEFFASALQLLHGGKDARLRERQTLKSLRALQMVGLLSAQDADGLEAAYLFLRRVENRLQMREERQTHTLPQSEEELVVLSHSLGFMDVSSFERELSRHRAVVKTAFGTLLGQTAKGEIPDEPLLALALDPDAAYEERCRALGERGFSSPEKALGALEKLARLPGSPFAATPGGPGLSGLKLLANIARTADPDHALLHLSEFLGQLRAPAGYLDLLANLPLASSRLLNVFGQSDYLSRYFLGHPQLLDSLIQGLDEEPAKPNERIRQEFAQRVRRAEDFEERLAAMRRYKNEEILRIGMHDISGNLDVTQVSSQLTALAEASLEECLFLAESELTERYGQPTSDGKRDGLSVIALGKLGGAELGYHSDLDLLFVYSGQAMTETSGGTRGKLTQHEYFAKWVQRLTSFLQLRLSEGYLYQIDARLRPSGNQGALVVSRQAFFEHHEKRAQLWERQALTRARHVAGDAALFDSIQRDTLIPLVYERPLPENAASEIARLRERMEKEIAQESEEKLDLKTGRGGLIDVEFTVQYLQLKHGKTHPSLRSTNTLNALDALEKRGFIAPADAQTLRRGYLFLRKVELRLRLVHGRSLSELPTEGKALSQLARRLGYFGAAPGETFLSEYRTFSEAVRQVYSRWLGSHAG